MQALGTRSWKSRVACGLAAVVASATLLGGVLGLFATGGGSVESAQVQVTPERAPAVAATSVRKGGGV